MSASDCGNGCFEQDPRLAGTPAGSALHVIRIDGRESHVVLTGWRHLLAPNADDKNNKGMVTGECGATGRPYVWKGVGMRATSTSAGVTCPKCKASERYVRMVGQVQA